MERSFLFTTCQIGAENSLKQEISTRWNDFRFAFSRPGFLTFRLPTDHNIPVGFSLKSLFARAYGFSLGKVEGEAPQSMAQEVWKLVHEIPVRRIHLWHRDRYAPGDHDFEPGLNEQDQRLHRALYRACPDPHQLAEGAEHAFCPGISGEFVLDCVVVEPSQWWIGVHRVQKETSRWPGGMLPLIETTDTISRAWWKFESCLRWSRFPIGCQTRCLDIGCSPGGASQALLARGAEVIGVDPAHVDPALISHPHFTHLQGKMGQIRRRHVRKSRWIFSDMNVTPTYTMEVLGDLVKHPQMKIRGILTTLKLFHWNQASDIASHLARFREWGFPHVQAAQLQFHRQEVVVAARK